jgi:hypothetical protein
LFSEQMRSRRHVGTELRGATVAGLICLLAPLGAVSCGGGGSGNSFHGQAKDLILSATDAKYAAVTTSIPVDMPDTEALRPGFKEGWKVVYEDQSPQARAEVGIYLYDNPKSASKAFDASCEGCSEPEMANETRVKQGSAIVASSPLAAAVGVCGNIYVAVATDASEETSRQLQFDGTSVLHAVLARAAEQGADACGT